MTVVSIIIMAFAAFAGFIAGAFLDDAMGGAILLALIAGIGCIIHTIERNGKGR